MSAGGKETFHLEQYEDWSIRADIYYSDYHKKVLLSMRNPHCILIPQTLWQAFKKRFFPDWLLKRYPVRYNKLYAVAYLPSLGLLPERHNGKYFTMWVEDLQNA